MTSNRSKRFVGPSLDYLHGIHDGLQIGHRIAWDAQYEDGGALLAADRIMQTINAVRADRLEAAVRVAGIDGLRGFWDPDTSADEYWPVL